MDRRIESDSDGDGQDYNDRRLNSLILRPVISSLPSITDDPDSEDDASCEAEVVFSNINWASQDLTETLLDHAPPSHSPSRAQLPAGQLDTNGTATRTARLPTPRSPILPAHLESAASLPVAKVQPDRDLAVGGDHSGTQPRLPPPSLSLTGTESGTSKLLRITEPDEPYEGQGWLSGAAGRLAGGLERRKAPLTATDEEQVAAAAQAAADLLQEQQRQQQQQGVSQQEGVAKAAGHTATQTDDDAAVSVLQAHRQREQAEEQRIARDFHEAVQAAEMEPPLLAPSGLSLEATVAGLGMDDLDALIARLSAGIADLQPAAAAAGKPGMVSQAAGGSGAGPSSLSWSLDLPAADSLWSDEEEVGPVTVPQQQPVTATQPHTSEAVENIYEREGETPVGSFVVTASHPEAASEGRPTGVATALPAGPVVAHAAAHVSAPQPPTVQGLPSGPPALVAGTEPQPLAARPQSKFKFFAGPAAGTHTQAGKGPAVPALRGAAPTSGSSGPVVMDLRQPISEAVERTTREAAATAALRSSAAKAAKAQRRLMAASSDSDEEEEEGQEEEAAAAAIAARRPHAPAPGAQVPTHSTPVAPPPVAARTPPTGAATAAPPPTAKSVGAVKRQRAALNFSLSESTTVSLAGSVSTPPETYSDNNGAATATSATTSATTTKPASTATGVSVGTDAADLRPANRSIFVCTAERETEEAERVADIREYLKARKAAAAAAAVAAAQQEAQERLSTVRMTAAVEGAAQSSRSWPEPPAEVLERMKSMVSSQRKTAAPTVDAGLSVKHPRAVASFAGIADVVADVVPSANNTHEASVSVSNAVAEDKVSSTRLTPSHSTASAPAADADVFGSLGNGKLTRNEVQAATCQGAGGDSVETSGTMPPAPPRVFAASSTEGDEELVAPPLPASFVDASRERGARMAAAGTFIPSSQSALAAPAPTESPATGDRNVGGQECKAASISCTSGITSTDNTASSRTASSASTAPLQVTSQPLDTDPRPALLQLPSPTSPSHTVPSAPASITAAPPTQAPSPSTATGPTASAPASAPAAPKAPSHRASADGHSPVSSTHATTAKSPRTTGTAPADLGRLPAWLPPSSCFTVLLTTPGNVSTLETAAVIAWLLKLAGTGAPPVKDSSSARALAAPSQPPPGMPAFSIVGLRLLGVAPTWELLPVAAAAAFKSQAAAGAGGGADVVRVLALACVPRAGLDPDTYNHELAAMTASDAASAAAAAQQIAAALMTVSWSELLPCNDKASSSSSAACRDADADAGDEGRVVKEASTARVDDNLGSLGVWSAVLPGASEALFSALRLSPHALSHHQPQQQVRSDVPTTAPGSSGRSGGVRSTVHHDAAAYGGGGGSMGTADGSSLTFACMVTSGGVRSPGLLSGLLTRAAASGLTLRGLQVVYAPEEAAAAVVAATPHRPLPYVGATVLALCGRNEPLRRWQTQLGPAVDARLAAATDPGSLHALYGDIARHITCSYDAATAAREVSALFDVPQSAAPTGCLPLPFPAVLAAAAPSQQRGQVASSRPTAPIAPQADSTGAIVTSTANAPPPAPSAATTTSSLTICASLQSQYLSLPACGARQQSLALWCLQHALFCGCSLRGLLLTSSPLPPHPSQPTQHHHHHHQPRTSSESPRAPRPSLMMELSKEEAAEQLPLLLTLLLSPGTMPVAVPGPSSASSVPPNAFAVPSSLAVTSASPSTGYEFLSGGSTPDMHSMPQPHLADQLLQQLAHSTATAGSAGPLPSGGGLLQSSTSGLRGSSTAHRDEDELTVVALQAKSLHAAALLLAALTAHVTGADKQQQQLCASQSQLAGQPQSQCTPPPLSPDRLELVACRYLRYVPSEVANRLRALQCSYHHNPQQQQQYHHPHHLGSGAVAATATECGGQRPVQPRLVMSHPALLAVFHGPSAQTRVGTLLQLALTWLQQAAGNTSSSSSSLILPAAAAAALATETEVEQQQQADTATWVSRLSALLRDYPTLATGPSPLAALSCSQAAAKHALAHAFSPAHVLLDAGMHDGIHRPTVAAAAATAASPSTAAVSASLSPLGWLLSVPERLPAIVALDFAALHRNLLPRLLKQLWREDYTLHAARTLRLQPSGAASAVLPALSGQPAMVLHVTRSNAVAHLRTLAATLAPAAGTVSVASAASIGSGGGLHTCGTWRDVVRVLEDVWPSRGTKVGDGGSPLAPVAGASARRFIRPEGCRLLQLTAMVAVPNPQQALRDGGPPSLDWPHLADALEALHAEKFRVAGVRALFATPRDLTHLTRATYRITPAQQRALQAATADTSNSPHGGVLNTAAGGGGDGGSGGVTSPGTESLAPLPPPCNLLLLALSRDNGVTSLQIMLDEAARCAGGGGGGGGAGQQPSGLGVGGGAAVAGTGAVPAGGMMLMSRGGGPGWRDAAAALAPVAHSLSVSHTPAAAEQQVCAVFDGVFGAGGMPLLQ